MLWFSGESRKLYVGWRRKLNVLDVEFAKSRERMVHSLFTLHVDSVKNNKTDYDKNEVDLLDFVGLVPLGEFRFDLADNDSLFLAPQCSVPGSHPDEKVHLV